MFEYYHAAICHRTTCLLDLALNIEIFFFKFTISFSLPLDDQQQHRMKNRNKPYLNHLFERALKPKIEQTFANDLGVAYLGYQKSILRLLWIIKLWFVDFNSNELTNSDSKSSWIALNLLIIMDYLNGTRKCDFNGTSWLEEYLHRNSSKARQFGFVWSRLLETDFTNEFKHLLMATDLKSCRMILSHINNGNDICTFSSSWFSVDTNLRRKNRIVMHVLRLYIYICI